MSKELKTFSLSTIDEVRAFESRLSEWQSRQAVVLDYINLENAFILCKSLEPREGGRLFSSILDLRLTFVMLNADLCSTFGNHNAIAKETGDPLENGHLFFHQMQELHHSINFIVRYRSFFDKFMAIILLIYASETVYDNYKKAKSRKAYFVNEARKIDKISSELVDMIEKLLIEFDQDFRTPEVHQTGRLRKFAFADMNYVDKPYITLNKFWNFLLPVLTAFDKVFECEIKDRGLI